MDTEKKNAYIWCRSSHGSPYMIVLKKNTGIIKLFSLLFNDLKYSQRKKNSTCDLLIVLKWHGLNGVYVN